MEKFSIAIVICCLLSLGSCFPQITEEQLDVNWQVPKITYPLKYEMVLITNSIHNESTYYGVVNITMQIRQHSSSLWIHSKDLDLVTMDLYESGGADNVTYLDILVNLINKQHDILRLDLYTKQYKHFYLETFKTYILQIKFKGSIRTDNTGFINIKSKNAEDNHSDAWMFVNVPKSARALFPCIDEPKYKSKFQLKVYHDPVFTAISNMPVTDCPSEKNSLSKGVTCFVTTPNLPAHMLGLVLLKNYMKKPIPSTDEKQLQQTFHATNSFDIDQTLIMIGASRVGIQKLSAYLNLSFDMPKLDHVIVHDLLPSVAETYGIIIHRESVFQAILPATDLERTMLVYYSLTRMWFETILTLPTRERNRLINGLASVVATKMLQEFPEVKEIKDFTQLQFCKRMSYFYNSKSITHISKGSTAYKLFISNENCFLSMLEHLLGAETFEKSVNIYLRKNALTNASRMTFVGAIQEATADPLKEPLYWLDDVDHILDAWTGTENFPSLDIEVDYDRSSIYVKQYDGDMQPTEHWTVPVRLSAVGRKSDEVFVVHPGKLVTIWRPIRSTECFYVDMEDKNMFHVFYDVNTLKCITKALKSYPDCISPRNRAAILRSFFIMNFENDLDRFEAYLDLLKYLYNEKHFYVWAIVTQAWTMPGTKRGFGNKMVDAGFGHFYHYLLTSLDINNLTKYDDTSKEDTTNGEFYLKKYVQFKFMELRFILAQEKENSIKALISKDTATSSDGKIDFNVEFLAYFCIELQKATYDELKTMFQIFTNFLDMDKVEMLAECSENPDIMEDLKEKYGLGINGSCGNETFVTFSGVCPRRSPKFYNAILKFIKPKKSDFDA